MSAASFFRLLCLAAIWGSSFLFMRIAAHSFGPAYLIEFRVLFAALSLLVVALYLKKNLAPLLRHPKHFLMIGLFNTALPFLCFAYAAQTLNASTLAVLNSTAVIWGSSSVTFGTAPRSPPKVYWVCCSVLAASSY